MANDPALVFLDANVLAGPVTRTLLLIGADESGLAVTGNAYAGAEAGRRLRGSALPAPGPGKRLDRVPGPAGAGPERFEVTSASDRQVLADAVLPWLHSGSPC